LIDGSTLPAVNGISFSGGSRLRNLKGAGIVSLIPVQHLTIDSVRISDIGGTYIDLTSAQLFTINNCTMQNGNANNTGANSVNLHACSQGTISNIVIGAGANTNPEGVALFDSYDMTVTNNVTTNQTKDYTVGAGASRIVFRGNRKTGVIHL
jgi:hypothetical protein